MTQGRKEVEVGTLLLGNNKNQFLLPIKFKLFLVFKLLGLNNFLLANADLSKDISLLYFLISLVKILLKK